jgi:subtilase family serine protease
MVVVDVYVRNSGDSIAQPVTVRCSVNERTIDNDQIAMISPGGLGLASCDWIVSEAAGEVELSIEIDWTGAIDETNEVNNQWSATLEVELGETMQPEDEAEKDDSILGSNVVMWGAVILLIIFGVLLLQLGPGRIQRIE